MPYQYHWYIEQRVIRAKIRGDQDIDELTRSSSEMLAMLEKGIPLVHVLMDDSEPGKVPVNLSLLSKAVSVRHQALGRVILIGAGSRIPNFLGEMLSKISRSNVRREATFEKAVDFLKERDITIPWEAANNAPLP